MKTEKPFRTVFYKEKGKTMKRIIAMLTAAVFLLMLAACSSGVSEAAGYSQIGSSSPYRPQSSEESSETPEPSRPESSEISQESSAQISSVSSEPESSEESSESSAESSKPEGGVVPQSARADASYFSDAVFVGDSVSLKLEYYDAAMDVLGGAAFLTSGSLGSGNALQEISEETVHPVYKGEKAYIEDSIADLGAKKVYIMLGMNDIGLYGIDDSIVNYETLVDRILEKSPNASIYVESMTPMTADSPIAGRDLNNDNIKIYNSRLQELAQRRGWYFVDVASVMYTDDGSALIPEYCSDPEEMGIHFTEAGCEAWVEYLYTHTAG